MQTEGLAGEGSSRSILCQIARHVDQNRFLTSSDFEKAAGGLPPVQDETTGGEMHVAEQHVIAGALEEGKSVVQVLSAIHA